MEYKIFKNTESEFRYFWKEVSEKDLNNVLNDWSYHIYGYTPSLVIACAVKDENDIPSVIEHYKRFNTYLLWIYVIIEE